MDQHPFHLLSISDLHLSASQSSPGAVPEVREGFIYDTVFAEFAQAHISYAQNMETEWHLLILGDGFDFLHTHVGGEVNGIFPASTLAASRKKLDMIFAAHPQFFDALGLLMAHGFHVDIVPGNHDIELVRTATQDWFRQKMLQHAPADVIHERLHFHPWLYYIPGVLYAEHGNQHHDINSFASLLEPVKDHLTGEIAHPIAAYLDLYVFHMFKHLAPENQTVHASLLHLVPYIRRQPLEFLFQTPTHLQFAWQVLKYILQRSSPTLKTKRNQYRQKNYPKYSPHIQLEPQILTELDEIAAIPVGRLVSRMFEKLTRKNITNDTYIRLAAPRIHTILKKYGKETAFYLFGHFHQPAKLPIDEKSFYLNDGAWTSDSFTRDAHEKTEFPYVHIRWSGAEPPVADILFWKAGTGTGME